MSRLCSSMERSPKQSKAPAFIKLSIVLRLTTLVLARLKKSASVAKPLSPLASKISSTTPVPTFFKAIIGKSFHAVPETFGKATLHFGVLNHALYKGRLHFSHGVALFFGNTFTQRIGLAAAKAAHVFGDLHKLFLVN